MTGRSRNEPRLRRSKVKGKECCFTGGKFPGARQTKTPEGKVKVFHSTDFDGSITEFKAVELGIHVASSSDLASNAVVKMGKREKQVIPLILDASNFVSTTGQNNGWNVLALVEDLEKTGTISEKVAGHYTDRYYKEVESETEDTFDVFEERQRIIFADLMSQLGFSGVKFWNTFDAGANPGGTGQDVKPDWSFIATKSNSLKSADPVTYGDDGKAIPPSQRGNPELSDIRL